MWQTKPAMSANWSRNKIGETTGLELTRPTEPSRLYRQTRAEPYLARREGGSGRPIVVEVVADEGP